MAFEINFDASTVSPSVGFDPIPNGTYRVHIADSSLKDSANGKYIELELEVLDGEFKGRKVWDRLNIVHSNTQAQEIAQRQLSAICHATNTLKLTSSDQLHFKPMTVKVVIKQDSGYEPSNVVKSYKSNDATPISGSTKPVIPAAQKETKVPWER